MALFATLRARLKWHLHHLRELAQAAYECQGDAVWITGRERSSGEAISVFYFGAYDRYDYLLDRLFTEYTVDRIEEDLWVWTGIRMVKRASECDIAIADLPWPYYGWLPHADYMHVPSVILHKVPLPGNWADMEERYRKRKTTRDDLNKFNKAQLSYRTTTGRPAIERFYHSMHVPYISRRHGAMVQVESLEDMVRVVQNGGALLEVLQGDRVVGGGVLYQIGRSMRFLWLGMPDDLESQLTDPVRTALYYFAMQFALSRTCSELNMMYTVPFLNDGIHRYKRKLGAHLHNDWKLGEVVFAVRKLTAAVQSFFCRLPMAVTDAQRRLSGHIMIAEQDISPEQLRRICQDNACEGLQRLRVFSARPLSEAVLAAGYGDGAPVEVRDLTRSSDPAADFSRT